MPSAETVYQAVLQLRADSTQLRQDLQTGRATLTAGLGDLKTLASTLVPVLSLGGIVAAGKQLMDLGDQLSDLSDRTGLSIAVLGGIRTVAEVNGSSLEAFAKGITIAQRNLGDLTGSGKEAGEALKAIGLNAKEMLNLSPDEFLEKLVGALKTVTNQNERAALAFKILGRAGVELVPTLNALAENGIKKLSKEAEAGFKALGDLKDKMMEVAGEAANFWAALLGANVKTDRQSFIAALAAEQQGIETLLNSLRTRLPESAQQDNKTIKDLEYRLAGIRALRTKLQAAEAEPAAKPAPARNLLGGGELDKAREQARQFFEGLDKQIEETRNKLKEGLLGAGTSIGDQLDADFKRFKDKLAADKLPIPAGLDARFAAFKQQILDGNDALRTQKVLLDQLNSRDVMDAEEQKNRQALIDKEREENKLTAERINLLEREKNFGVFDLIDAEQGQQIEDYRQRVRDLGQAYSDLTGRELEAAQLSAVLGTSFDLTSEKVAIQRERLQLLVKDVNALPEQVQQAANELKKLEAQQSLENVFKGLGDSISRGIQDTITGISEGSQTLSDGLRNMLRNVFLSLNSSLVENFILKPIKDLANAFFSGLAEAFAQSSDDAGKKIAADLGRSLGTWLRDAFKDLGGSAAGGQGGGGLGSIFGGLFSAASSSFGSIFSGLGTWIGSFFEQGGLVPAFVSGGMVPSFAGGGFTGNFQGGGLAKLHGGEFVLKRPAVDQIGIGTLARLNSTGSMPDSGGRNETQVIINGDIVPRERNMTKDDVIKVVTKNLSDRGVIMHAFEQRTSIKGG